MDWIRSILKSTDINNTYLHHAVLYESIDSVRDLIDNGEFINQIDQCSHTPLHKIAFLIDDTEIYDKTLLLLDKGANINAKTITGTTLLHWAVTDLSYDMINLLIDRGADPTIVDEWGYTPLDMAKLYSKNDVIRLLSSSHYF